MQNKQTEISEVGEFGLIKKIREILNFRVDDATLHDNLIQGIDDDAAVFRPSPGKVQLFTTDAFVEGIHFDLTYTSLRHLGWKAMVASFSDIAAMGGIPRYAIMTLSLPKKISVEMVEELYTGAAFACKKYSCLLIGGDTTSSLANMTVSVALIGEANEGKVVYRKGAKPGDYLCVSGHLGGSVAGLKILQREKQRFSGVTESINFRPNLEPYTPALEKHLMPKPRLDIAKILTEHIAVNAMIDISDGLASEVYHLCESGSIGASVHEHNLPVEVVTQNIAAELTEPVTDFALYGGEEYELLFTLNELEFLKLEKLTNDVTVIGRITEQEKGITLVRENGENEELRLGGWNHFSQ